MKIHIYTDWDAFTASQMSNWKRLAALPRTRTTVFQTAEWATVWWRHFGGKGRRFLGLAFEEQGKVVGIAPFWRDPLTAEIRLLGDGESDYLDIIAHPEHEVAVVGALWNWLAGDGRRYRLEVRQAPPCGVLATHANDAAAGKNVSIALVVGEPCPVAALPDTWTAFTKTLGKKRRGNIGYYERQLEKHFGEIEFALSGEETLAEDMAAFFELHQRRWNARWLPGAFVSGATRRFHYDAARTLLGSGHLRLHTLLLHGRVEAALYCFHHAGVTYYYLGGFEPELARFSPGMVLTARAIRHAIEVDNATAFDFLRGNEAYKYGWGAVDRCNVRLFAGKRGVAVPVAAMGARATLAVELGLKTWMHARFGGAGAKHEGAKKDG